MPLSVGDVERIREIVREEIKAVEEEKRRLEANECRCGPGGMPLDGCSRHPWEPVMKRED